MSYSYPADDLEDCNKPEDNSSSQVAAKCGVSNRRQLTDSLLHLVTLDSDLSSIVSSPSAPSISPVPHSIPLQYHINVRPAQLGVPFAGYLPVIDQSNSHSTNNSQAPEPSEPETSAGRVLCLGGSRSRMVSPAGGHQETSTVSRGSGNNSGGGGSKNSNNNNNSSTKNRNNNYKSNNKSNSKNKELVGKGVEPEQRVDKPRALGEGVPAERRLEKCRVPEVEYDAQVHGYLESVSGGREEKGEDGRFNLPQLPAPSKAVDAKEVEKLLQNALWKGSQQLRKNEDGGESTSSGGCDTGYSSRCSTPPGPSILPADACTDAADPKHGTKRHLDVPIGGAPGSAGRESRSESPSACSVGSQGSYRNPRQKRRYNNDGRLPYYPGHPSHHHHHVNYHHSQPHHHQHHQHHHHNNQHHGGGGYGGPRGNGQYYSYRCPDPANGDGYQGRRYEGGHGGYDYYGRYERHGGNFGINEGHHGRFNRGRGYNNNNNGYNSRANQYDSRSVPQGGESGRDRGRPLGDRAGTFSEERVNGNNRWMCEVVDTPGELSAGSEWDSLSRQVWDTFKRHQQTNKTFVKKLRLKEKIFRIIRNVLPNCRLYVVGSSLSGFGADCSDVDMCLMVTPGDLDQRTEATAVLRLLQQELNHYGYIQKMELIRAKVPILKFRDSFSQVDVDLNCNNAVGIRNTHLLNSYSQLDWRVRPLVLVVKLWAQHHNINNAKDMTISSYSLVLMVIHYLQHGVEPPVLPCLQKTYPQKFRAGAHITTIPVTEKMPTFTSNNHDTLGKLFHGFLNYFANDFTFIEETISVRTGGTVPTVQCRSVRSRKNDARMWKYLCIEEPFDLTNTARSVYDEAVFERVKKVFVDSYKLIDEKRDLSSILS